MGYFNLMWGEGLTPNFNWESKKYSVHPPLINHYNFFYCNSPMYIKVKIGTSIVLLSCWNKKLYSVIKTSIVSIISEATILLQYYPCSGKVNIHLDPSVNIKYHICSNYPCSTKVNIHLDPSVIL